MTLDKVCVSINLYPILLKKIFSITIDWQFKDLYIIILIYYELFVCGCEYVWWKRKCICILPLLIWGVVNVSIFLFFYFRRGFYLLTPTSILTALEYPRIQISFDTSYLELVSDSTRLRLSPREKSPKGEFTQDFSHLRYQSQVPS